MTANQKIALPFIICLFALPLVFMFRRNGKSVNGTKGKARITYVDDLEPVGMNEEEWVWVDYKGRQRSLTVHRKVKSRW